MDMDTATSECANALRAGLLTIAPSHIAQVVVSMGDVSVLENFALVFVMGIGLVLLVP